MIIKLYVTLESKTTVWCCVHLFVHIINKLFLLYIYIYINDTDNLGGLSSFSDGREITMADTERADGVKEESQPCTMISPPSITSDDDITMDEESKTDTKQEVTVKPEPDSEVINI